MAPPISPAACASGLPCSSVRSLANSPLRAASASAIFSKVWRRSSIVVADQVLNAVFAAATAASSCALSARAHVVSRLPVAGLITSRVVAPSTNRPSINSRNSWVSPRIDFRFALMVFALCL